MIQNPDGSVVLSPGEQAPAGYQVVRQNPDGSVVAAPQGGQTPAQVPAGSSNPVVAGLAAKKVYDMAKGAVSPAGTGPTTAATTAAATGGAAPAGTVIGVDAAGRQVLSTGGSAAGATGLSSVLSGPGLYAGGPNVAGAALGAGMIAAGAYGTHNQYGSALQGSTMNQGLQGAANGALVGGGIGSFVPGVGTALGAGVGAVVGGVAGLARGVFGSRRSGFELMTRAVNDYGGKSGLFYSPAGTPKGSAQAHMKLADGSLYNIETGGYAEAGDDKVFSVDPNAKWGKQAVAWAGILGDVMTGGPTAPEGASIYATGTIANGILSNSNGDIEVVRANMLQQIENMGLDQEKLEAALTQLRDSGKIDQALYEWRMNDLKSLFNGAGYDPRTMQEWVTRDQQTAPGATPGQPSTTGPAPLPNGAPGLPPGNRVAQNIKVGPNVQAAANAANGLASIGTVPTIGFVEGNTLVSRPPAGINLASWMPGAGGSTPSSGLPAGYRPGSARAGGIVDNKTGKWYPDANSIPR